MMWKTVLLVLSTFSATALSAPARTEAPALAAMTPAELLGSVRVALGGDERVAQLQQCIVGLSADPVPQVSLSGVRYVHPECVVEFTEWRTVVAGSRGFTADERVRIGDIEIRVPDYHPPVASREVLNQTCGVSIATGGVVFTSNSGSVFVNAGSGYRDQSGNTLTGASEATISSRAWGAWFGQADAIEIPEVTARVIGPEVFHGSTCLVLLLERGSNNARFYYDAETFRPVGLAEAQGSTSTVTLVDDWQQIPNGPEAFRTMRIQASGQEFLISVDYIAVGFDWRSDPGSAATIAEFLPGPMSDAMLAALEGRESNEDRARVLSEAARGALGEDRAAALLGR